MTSFSLKHVFVLIVPFLLIIGAGYFLLNEPVQQHNTQLPIAVSPTSPLPPPTNDKSCMRGGCSGELCTDAGPEPAVSNCLYVPKFACYKTARCARQADGACGWTQTEELRTCLAQPPKAE